MVSNQTTPLPASSQSLTPFEACCADQSNFHFPCSSVSKQLDSELMVLFRQYRFLKQPEKMCERDRLWLVLRFKALYCFKESFGSPVPRDGSTVSSFWDKCNPILLKDSTSCNQMSPLHKCTVFLTFGERRKQKSGFVLAALHCLRLKKI